MDKTNNHVQYSLLNNILHNKRLNHDEIEKIIFIIKDLEEFYNNNKDDFSLKNDIDLLYIFLKKNYNI
tara:strand:+ start:918 stop:1121 length:204 start_codon:yes stop_codon:yes gene_type:complete